MPINLDDFKSQLDHAELEHPTFVLEREEKITRTVAAFLTPPILDNLLRERVERVTQRLDRLVRCVTPLYEPSSQVFPEPNLQTGMISVFAGDGSDIAPPTTPENFGLLNLSALSWIRCPSMQISHIDTQIKTRFYFEKDAEHLNSEETFSVLRDVAEREFVCRTAVESQVDGPCLILIDGPLEIWGRREMKRTTYQAEVRRVQRAYAAAHQAGIWTIGYIDQPNSSNLIHMLAIANCPENQLGSVRDIIEYAYGGLNDRMVLEKILPPGARTAVFQIAGRSTGLMKGELGTCCFFVNCGDIHEAHIARIEVPQWIASQPGAISTIQMAILEQVRLVPGGYYPFLLARAHEEAVLNLETRAVIDRMIWERFGQSGQISTRPKEFAKKLGGGGR
jgi:hypothetical protein